MEHRSVGEPRRGARDGVCRRPSLVLGSALDLAVTRVAVCAVVLASSELWDAPAWASRAAVLRHPTPGLGWALPLLDSRDAWLLPLQLACAASTALALLGVFARPALVLSALSSLALFALPHLSGGPRHSMHLVWFLAILAVSPCDRRLRLLPRVRRRARGAELHGMLSMAALRAALACVYFFPGLWKLEQSGLEWIFSDNLQNHMYWKWLQFGQIPAFRIDRYPALVQAAALGVVVLEVSFPLLMLTRLSRLSVAALGLGFHLAAGRLMFLPFAALWGCYAMLVDWERVLGWFHDARPVTHRVSWATLRVALRGRLAGAARRPAFWLSGAVMAAVLAGAIVQGFRGQMRSYPFACYPTFQWIARPVMPDLWIALVRDGEQQWVADSPARGGTRAQPLWAAAWQAAGVYGEAPSPQGLWSYFELVTGRHALEPGQRVRFYRAEVFVAPEKWQSPPQSLMLLAELDGPP